MRDILYGVFVSFPSEIPSIKNSTLDTPTLSHAVAVKINDPEYIQSSTGDVTVTVGGVVSGVLPVLLWFGVEREKVSRVREPILESEFQMVIAVVFAGATTDAVNVSGVVLLFAGTVLRN